MLSSWKDVVMNCLFDQDLITSSENFQLFLCLGGSLRLLGHVASIHVQPLLKRLYAVLLGGKVGPVQGQC